MITERLSAGTRELCVAGTCQQVGISDTIRYHCPCSGWQRFGKVSLSDSACIFFCHAPMHGEMPIYSRVTPGVGIRAGLGHVTSCCILQPLSAPAGQHTAEPSIKSRRQRRSKAGLSLKDKVLEKASTPTAAEESTPEPTYSVPARDFKWRQHLPCVTPLLCARMHPNPLASGTAARQGRAGGDPASTVLPLWREHNAVTAELMGRAAALMHGRGAGCGVGSPPGLSPALASSFCPHARGAPNASSLPKRARLGFSKEHLGPGVRIPGLSHKHREVLPSFPAAVLQGAARLCCFPIPPLNVSEAAREEAPFPQLPLTYLSSSTQGQTAPELHPSHPPTPTQRFLLQHRSHVYNPAGLPLDLSDAAQNIPWCK